MAGNILTIYRTIFADHIGGRQSYPLGLKCFIIGLNPENKLTVIFFSSDKEIKHSKSTENYRLAIN